MPPPITSADRIYRALRDRIMFGDIKSGARLVHRDLSREFEASNTPVIEALRRLERDGLVEQYPNYGAAVRTWTLDDIRTLFALREALEAQACRWFAERAGPVDRLAAAEYAREYARVVESDGARRERVLADLAFHMHIVKACNCSYLRHAAESTGVLAMGFLPLRPGAQADAGVIEEHRALAEALGAQDAPRAEELARAHVRRTLEKIEAEASAAGSTLQTEALDTAAT